MSKFPVLFAGQRFTAALAGQMEPDYYVKNTATARASNITTVDDPDLVIPVVAGEVCLCEFWVKYNSPAVSSPPTLKTTWGSPTGTAFNRQVTGAGSAETNGNADSMLSHWGVHGQGTGESYGARGAGGQQLWLLEWAIVTVGGSAGNITFQWGQTTSNTNPVTVNSGSYAKHIRLG